MDCPVCGEKLREIERSGVMVDICPSCKGVWLDRGEIDKLIQAENGAGSVGASTAPRRDRDDHDDDDRRRESKPRDDDYPRSSGSSSHGSSSRPKRSSLLADLLGGLGGE